MNQVALIWVALLVGAAVSGASVVGVLVVRREMELAAALLGVAGFGIAAFAFAEIFQIYSRPDAALWALAFMVAAGGGGYALASTLLYRYGSRTTEPVLPDELPPDPGVPAVILVASVESRSYDPRETAKMLQSLADEDLLDASIGILPFLFFAQKARYRVIADNSPAASELAAVSDRLAAAVSDSNVRVDWAGNSAADTITGSVATAAARGHRKIVVAELFVAEPGPMQLARTEIASLRLESHGVDVRFTGNMSGAERILAMLADRIIRAANGETGVVLVGHGQPAERSEAYPSFDEQETVFLNRLRMLLTEKGVAESSVRIAWAEWGDPDVTSTVRHLAALGCRRILVVPAVYPLDAVTTKLDLEISVRQARVSEGTVATTLPTWRDDDAVIEELRARVVAALAE